MNTWSDSKVFAQTLTSAKTTHCNACVCQKQIQNGHVFNIIHIIIIIIVIIELDIVYTRPTRLRGIIKRN